MTMFYFKEKTHRRVAPARVNLIPIPVEMQVTSAVASFEKQMFCSRSAPVRGARLSRACLFDTPHE